MIMTHVELSVVDLERTYQQAQEAALTALVQRAPDLAARVDAWESALMTLWNVAALERKFGAFRREHGSGSGGQAPADPITNLPWLRNEQRIVAALRCYL